MQTFLFDWLYMPQPYMHTSQVNIESYLEKLMKKNRFRYFPLL